MSKNKNDKTAVLLTRPSGQAANLETLLEKNGFLPLRFPSLEIVPLKFQPPADFDIAIFISVNAVDFGVSALQSVPRENYQLFAVGAQTARRLENYDLKADDYPQKNASSEALLALMKNIRNRRVVIFRGEGGRETLRAGLRGQKNQVRYLAVYERRPAPAGEIHKYALEKFFSTKRGIITATSVENLEATMMLAATISGQKNLNEYPLALLSERIRKTALGLGFDKISAAREIDDESLVGAVKILGDRYFEK